MLILSAQSRIFRGMTYRPTTKTYRVADIVVLSKFLATGNPSPFITLPFQTVAQMVRQNPLPVPPTSDSEYTRDIPMRDGSLSNIRIHKSNTSKGSPTPLVVLIYGGGFCIGHNTHISIYSRAIAKLYDATVVNISYRLAPEFKFPTAPNDVWDSLEWITTSENASTLGVDISTGFYIGGTSAGANLAAVTTQRWTTEQRQPKLRGLWLNVPYVLEDELVPAKYKHLWFSREQNADSLIWSKAAIDYLKENYEPDVRSPDFSPFNAKNPHKGLPPVHIQVCGQDPLRDDGLIYESVLRENGVSTRLDVYPGVPHSYVTLVDGLKGADKYRVDTLQGFGWLFGKDASDEACLEAYAVAQVGPA
jgi:acetyl esterase/lipase